MNSSVLVDTDPCLGSATRDVDDVLAIVHLLAHGVDVAGLTTCFGNAPLDDVTRVARSLGRRFDLPVHAGASRPGDVDTAAVDRLVAHDGTVVAIAPLTNVAAALARGASWDRLIVLGGTDRRLPNLRPLHTTELNLALDERAAAIALEACTDLVPMEVCRTVWFGAPELAGAAPWLREGCRRWRLTSPIRTGRFAFHPWDVLAATLLTHPDALQSERARPMLASRPGWRGSVVYCPGDANVVRAADRAAIGRAWADSAAWTSRR